MKRLLLGAACLAVVGYGVIATIHVRQLETQLREARLPEPPAQIAYSFDSSFIQYFGQSGVDAVNRAVKARGVTDPDELHELLQRLNLRLK